MKHPFGVSQNLYLRALERSDINEDYLQWINDPEVTKYMATGTFPTNMEKLQDYYQRMRTNRLIMA